MQAKRWLKRVGWLLLVLVSLALIFNQQIKYYLVGSYRPTITKTLVQKNQQKQVNQKDFDFSQTKDLNFVTYLNNTSLDTTSCNSTTTSD